MQARIEEAEMVYIIRDQTKKNSLLVKNSQRKLQRKLMKKYGNVVEYELYDQYYNMGDVI